MFCPRCATENGLEQGYCRQCGQALSDVRLAIDGVASESLEKLTAGTKWLNAGIATLIVFTIIGILLTILGIALGDQTFSTIGMINVLLGVLFGFPLMLIGKTDLKRANRLLSAAKPQVGHAAPKSLQRPSEFLTAGLDKNVQQPAVPGSVTEHTTLDLPERGRSVALRQKEKESS
ncbi:MAG TPA: hypothetical protein VKM94_26520 [Blastocatellia bacterium]|nr:hypothetical protein [Blastocatellia bacterium]